MIDPKPSPLSPGALLNGLHVTTPNGPVTVGGVVERVNLYERSAYVTLSGEGGIIEARVPADAAPAVHATVQVTGMVNVRPDRFGKGLSVIIHGNVDGAGARRVTQHVVELHKPRRIPLELLLQDRTLGVEDLVVIGTERANSDLAGQLIAKQPRFQRVSTIDPAAIVGAARDAVKTGARALIFARGGSADVTEDLWDDPRFVGDLLALGVPFYTAIGHSDRMHVADKWADQPFATPTHIGAELQAIVTRRAAREREVAELSRLRAEAARLQRALGERERDLAPTPAFSAFPAQPRLLHVRLSPQAWALLAAIVIVVVAVATMFRH